MREKNPSYEPSQKIKAVFMALTDKLCVCFSIVGMMLPLMPTTGSSTQGLAMTFETSRDVERLFQ